ncbi:MAG: KH domain-containing protein [Kiritimatiellaeota bacterium]|nr:KH domain-containing protein [Kiritimatiellota bacterium]
MIKKILGFLKGDDAVEPQPASSDGKKDLEHFVDYVVRALVDSPEQVCIALGENERQKVIQVRCAKEDIGKIIGKNGKTISAIRALVNGAGRRFELNYTVEVLD